MHSRSSSSGRSDGGARVQARMRGIGWMACVVAVLAAVLLLALPTHAASGSASAPQSRDWSSARNPSRHEQETLQGLDQRVVDDAARHIQREMDYAQDVNQRAATKLRSNALYSGSEAAKQLLAEAIDYDAAKPKQQKADSFAFLSQKESASPSASHELDVEASLDTIAAELDSLFSGEEGSLQQQIAQSVAQATQRTIGGASVRQRAQQAAESQQAQQQKQRSQASAHATAPSARQQKLIRRLDSYRTARGHAGAEREEVSMLEASSAASADAQAQGKANARANAAQGYALPSAYAPGVIAGPAAAASAGMGLVQPNPALWSQLGVTVPTAAPAAAPVAPVSSTPAPNIAGVGVLLRALQKVQEEAATNSLMSKLSHLLAASQQQNQQHAAQQQMQQPMFGLPPMPAPQPQPQQPQAPQPTFDPFSYGPNPLAFAPQPPAAHLPQHHPQPQAPNHFFHPNPVAFGPPTHPAQLGVQQQMLPQNLHSARVEPPNAQRMEFPQ